MAKRMLTDGSKSVPVVEADDLSTEPGRFALYLQRGSFAEVARAARVSSTAIKHQADRYRWRERKLDHDRKLGLTRAAAASTKTLATLGAVEDAISEETASWDDADGDVDKLARAAGVVSVVDKLAKVQREAIADLPPEREPAVDLSKLSHAAFAVWGAYEQFAEALKAITPASPYVAPTSGEAAVIVALLESDVGKAFIRQYEREHGLQTMGLV